MCGEDKKIAILILKDCLLLYYRIMGVKIDYLRWRRKKYGGSQKINERCWTQPCSNKQYLNGHYKELLLGIDRG